MHVYRDLFDNEIKVGDYIAYSAIDGRSGTLRIGQVIELTETKKPSSWTGKKEPKILAKSWSNFRQHLGTKREQSGRQSNVSLSFMDRMIVLPKELVSEKIKNDLDNPCGKYC